VRIKVGGRMFAIFMGLYVPTGCSLFLLRCRAFEEENELLSCVKYPSVLLLNKMNFGMRKKIFQLSS